MKTLLMLATFLLLAGCATYQGGSEDETTDRRNPGTGWGWGGQDFESPAFQNEDPLAPGTMP